MKRAIFSLLIFSLFGIACHSSFKLNSQKPDETNLSGSQFYKMVSAWQWKERDSLAVDEILKGNFPSFLKNFVRINVTILTDDGKIVNAHYFVMPDYLSVGNNADWARVPITPMAAQIIADSFQCFLPTTKMVDDIYKLAKVKLEPMPMFAYRDSSPTFFQHHLIIEGQRKGRKGLIAGIKKDVVISEKLVMEIKQKKVAIYGWHKLDGKPIQPLYTGHVNWYVDYSHGIRLVYKTIWVNGKPMDYRDVLKHRQFAKLLCNDPWCNEYKY